MTVQRNDGADTEASAAGALGQRRLQRSADFTGRRIVSFQAVFLRHGLPGLLMAALFLAPSQMRSELAESLEAFAAAPMRYSAVALAVLLGMLALSAARYHRLDARQTGWILYLLAVSAWEEWVFRLAIPEFGVSRGLDLGVAVVLSNVLFGLMHYFTLRWKWYWCVAACLGGIGLSRQMALHHDLALVVGIHWVATFLNTPRPPRGSEPG